MKIKQLLYIGLLFWALPLAGLMPDSAFSPELQSRFRISLLQNNDQYHEKLQLPLTEGLRHPLESGRVFKENFIEAFANGQSQHSLLSYRHAKSDFSMYFNIFAGCEYSWADGDPYRFWYKGWDVSATKGKRLKLYSSWNNGAFFGNLDAAETDELIDGYYKRFEKQIQLDNMRGYISYSDQDYGVRLGRGNFQIAPSVSGSIILSDQVNDYDYILAEGRAGHFSLSMLHASLMADSTYSAFDNPLLDARNYPDKYIALHQLNYRPQPQWNLYVGESVVYGNRGLDLAYILPNSFWRAVEHNLWDRDNVLIYAGLVQKPRADLQLYCQLAIDELSYSKIFSNWWGNKYAVQTGARQTRKNGDSTLEITAVRPYTYTHFQAHTMYSHDGRSLGYPLGSNLLNFTLENNQKLIPCLDWSVVLAYTLQGSEGADYRINYHDVFAGQIDSAQAQWFAGEKSHQYSLANSLLCSFFAHHNLLFTQKSKYISGWEHQFSVAWQFIY